MIEFSNEKELYYRKIMKICYALQRIFICSDITADRTEEYGPPCIHFKLIKGTAEYNTSISYVYFEDLSTISIVGYLSNEFIGQMLKEMDKEL